MKNQFYCSDCEEFNGWESKDEKVFETCNFCGKQKMCVDATGVKLEVKERPIEDIMDPKEKTIFAKIVELDDRQVLLTKHYDSGQNLWFLKAESDYGVGRYGVQIADKAGEGIDKAFDEFGIEEAKKLVEDVKAQIKKQDDELKKIAEEAKSANKN